jgi:hypothetical protein
VKPAKDIAQEIVLWVAVTVLILILVGCADLRHLTMTKEELRLYRALELKPCMPDNVCIVE